MRSESKKRSKFSILKMTKALKLIFFFPFDAFHCNVKRVKKQAKDLFYFTGSFLSISHMWDLCRFWMEHTWKGMLKEWTRGKNYVPDLLTCLSVAYQISPIELGLCGLLSSFNIFCFRRQLASERYTNYKSYHSPFLTTFHWFFGLVLRLSRNLVIFLKKIGLLKIIFFCLNSTWQKLHVKNSNH